MRIGLFTDTYTPEVNGVVTVLTMMTRELRREGHEVYVFCPSHPSGDSVDAGVYRFPSLRFPFYKGIRLAIPYDHTAIELISTLDIIHSHDPGPLGLLATWASATYHIPHVHTYHTLYTYHRCYLPKPIRPTRRMVAAGSRLLCNRCDVTIAPSTQMEHELRTYGVTSPIYALPYGVDEEEFAHEVTWDIKTVVGFPTEDLLLYVGRLGKEKNLRFLLRSFERLLRMHPTAGLIIVGDGPERQPLERYAASLGIAPHVVFTGFLQRTQLIDLYKQALFVFASKSETQGLVLMEALMAGAAVVAVGVMGPVDMIVSGETGILVEEDEGEFAEACHQLLLDRERRRTLGLAAQRYARSHNSRVSTIDLLGVYAAARARAAACPHNNDGGKE